MFCTDFIQINKFIFIKFILGAVVKIRLWGSESRIKGTSVETFAVIEARFVDEVLA